MESQWFRGILAVVLVCGIGGSVTAADAPGAEGVARVNGAPITRAQLDAEIGRAHV